MTTADDALFEPLNGPVVGAGSFTSGILRRPDATAIDINSSNPKQLYLDAAAELIDLAVKCHPQWIDVRLWPAGISGHKMLVPAGALRLDTLVDRFHDGNKEFWVACPGLTAPKQFDFAGRFGHFKVWRFAQHLLNAKMAQFVADWFWVDSTDGQMSAIELGVIILHPNMQLHHIFSNRLEADAYFKT